MSKIFDLIFNERAIKRYALFGVVLLVFLYFLFIMVSPDEFFEYFKTTASDNLASAIEWVWQEELPFK